MGKRKLDYHKRSIIQRSKHANRMKNQNTRSDATSIDLSSPEGVNVGNSEHIYLSNSQGNGNYKLPPENEPEEGNFLVKKETRNNNSAVKSFGGHESSYGCNSTHMTFLKELRNGLNCKFVFKCSICGAIEKLFSNIERDSSKDMGINEAVVFGNLCTGQSFTQMDERFSIMNMPTMSSRTYYDIQKHVHEVIKENAVEEMAEAAEAEKAEAISKGELDSDGFTLLTVVVDGTWAKKSYKSK